jgi:hypothetical protein
MVFSKAYPRCFYLTASPVAKRKFPSMRPILHGGGGEWLHFNLLPQQPYLSIITGMLFGILSFGRAELTVDFFRQIFTL